MSSETPHDHLALPKFYFSFTLGALENPILFQEVEGLDTNSAGIDTIQIETVPFSTLDMPKSNQAGNIVLKKGVATHGSEFRKWLAAMQENTVERESIIIELLDAEGIASMKWTLKNAWPTRITESEMLTDGKQITIERLELAHEGLTTKSMDS